MPRFRWATAPILAAGLSCLLPNRAGAIPAFARRYKASCQPCHNPFPTLTEFGGNFAANGYRMAFAEEPRGPLQPAMSCSH
jgi:hypothetical protein